MRSSGANCMLSSFLQKAESKTVSINKSKGLRGSGVCEEFSDGLSLKDQVCSLNLSTLSFSSVSHYVCLLKKDEKT